MIKNRLFAIIYRCVFLSITISGLILGSGFTDGAKTFLFFTTQSNIIIALLTTYLLIKTIIDYAKRGRFGSASYLPRTQGIFTIMIIFIMVIFWCVIAPYSKHKANCLLCFGNLTVHTFTPILAMIDYLLFCERGAFKKKDVFLSLIVPLIYITESTILALFKVVFYQVKGVDYYYPYLFMDFNFLGIYALFSIIICAILYLFFAYAFYKFDNKKTSKKRHILSDIINGKKVSKSQ